MPRGQTEAAARSGCRACSTLRLVLLPQALRVIVPPLTSQYLNLTKNSSLAVAIGYPDVVSIANTTINQNGQALECVLMIMTVYLAINLVTALLWAGTTGGSRSWSAEDVLRARRAAECRRFQPLPARAPPRTATGAAGVGASQSLRQSRQRR